MMIAPSFSTQSPLRQKMTQMYRYDETQCVNALLAQMTGSSEQLKHIQTVAHQLVEGIRAQQKKQGSFDRFLHEYDLSSEEGIALMCLAEALLRIPDKATVDRLIADKISTAEWEQHLRKSDAFFVNAATLSLLVTGKLFSPTLNREQTLGASLKRWISRAGGALVRPVVRQAMQKLGNHFVMGQTIQDAQKRAKQDKLGYRYSYDMLGESARTQEDAMRYFQSYQNAIIAIGESSQLVGPVYSAGISVKLSALHPRYEVAKRERVMQELVPALLALAECAKQYDIGLTVDAEEADRLDLSLDVFEAVFSSPSLIGWEGLGLAVQAYQKRAPFVLDWIVDLSKRFQRRIMVRLVKGAYWDTEIKVSQMLGLPEYPVFTRKNSTDVSYLVCAKKMLEHPAEIYCQFGTHNAYSVAAILEWVGPRRDFEFQCLHGLGETLYDYVLSEPAFENIACRMYAPVGTHKDLLSYLVRRLLENGANTSFINQIADANVSDTTLLRDPFARIAQCAVKPHPHIPLPKDLFGKSRLNSRGMDLSDIATLQPLQKAMQMADTVFQTSKRPADATTESVKHALDQAVGAFPEWAHRSIDDRATILERAAELLETKMAYFMTFLVREGKKCIPDAVSEVREAIDFCRYYAERARKDLTPTVLQGPTGEWNELSLHPRGMMVCISPWNFPLAIFMGQVVAALVTGNTVIAKPAEQTPMIAEEAVKLLHEAGVPKVVLQCVPGKGEIVGAQCVADPRVAGVMFTGSTETAKAIQQTLAHRPGPLVPLIAETGGQNAMIVDSSALFEQVVMDVIQSAFNSAGQRCSALRVLFIQEDIADGLLAMLKGAMAELTVGDPSLLSTDVGPVIDSDALAMLENHFAKMKETAELIYQVQKPAELQGHYFGPCVFEIKDLSVLKREVFGPFLHVIRYAEKRLDQVIDSIIETGYGLTFGMHSRIDATIQYVKSRLPVGNMYVNRNMIGAVVGVQPFGGEGLSGTGPKAGGPYYLHRLCVERAISVNTTASGGNATLLSLSEDDS